MPRSPRARAPLSVGLLCLTLVACGSTVQQQGVSSLGPQAGSAVDDGLGGAGPLDPGAVTGELGVPASGTAGPGGGSVEGSGTATGGMPGGEAAAPGSTGSTPAGGAATGDGASGAAPAAGTVQVGVQVSEGAEEFYRALGLSQLSLGDTKAQASAIIADINSRGGLAGRKIQPVFAVTNPNNDKAVQEQASCEAWTADNSVFAAVSPLQPTTRTLIPCLAKKNVPMIGGGVLPYDAKDFQSFPSHFYSPYGYSLSRLMGPYVKRLHAQGYFGDDPTIGVLMYEQPVFSRALPSLTSELGELGYEVAVTATATYPESTSGLGATSNQIAAAVLKFRSEGVSHVLFLEGGGGMPLGFMVNAENQNYRPRYGLYSYSGPAALLQTAAPPAQLRRSLGVGWVPLLDVDASRDSAPTPARQRCRKVMAKANQDMSNRLTEATALAYCDNLYFLEQTVNAGGLDVTAVRRTVDGLGTRFASGITFGTSFSAQQHDGATSVRDLAYQDSCSCFAYTSPPRQVR